MNGGHPYLTRPDRSYWSRAVSRHWNTDDLFSKGPLLKTNDLIMSAGSCFAANVVGPIEQAGYSYLRTEDPFAFEGDDGADRFGYGNYTAGYGNIYTPRQLLQLLRRSLGQFQPKDDCWIENGSYVDPFRPGLPYPASSREELDAMRASHLDRVREAFERATLLFFTLGLTETWISRDDGAVFPACPGTISGTFDAERHLFANLTVADVCGDMDQFVRELAAINPKCRIVLTVSPIPLVATMTDDHVATATSYSKSVLRVACTETERKFSHVTYFPAYEMFVGPQAEDFYKPDRRNISEAGVAKVMQLLFANSETPPARTSEVTEPASAASLSKLMVDRECEEMMQDPHLKSGERS